jgi:hypothetical protein
MPISLCHCLYFSAAISEDSDYTSDISFPTGAGGPLPQHQANQSAHQFESHLRPHGYYPNGNISKGINAPSGGGGHFPTTTSGR